VELRVDNAQAGKTHKGARAGDDSVLVGMMMSKAKLASALPRRS
jgi:hypothetical protein